MSDRYAECAEVILSAVEEGLELKSAPRPNSCTLALVGILRYSFPEVATIPGLPAHVEAVRYDIPQHGEFVMLHGSILKSTSPMGHNLIIRPAEGFHFEAHADEWEYVVREAR